MKKNKELEGDVYCSGPSKQKYEEPFGWLRRIFAPQRRCQMLQVLWWWGHCVICFILVQTFEANQSLFAPLCWLWVIAEARVGPKMKGFSINCSSCCVAFFSFCFSTVIPGILLSFYQHGHSWLLAETRSKKKTCDEHTCAFSVSADTMSAASCAFVAEHMKEDTAAAHSQGWSLDMASAAGLPLSILQKPDLWWVLVHTNRVSVISCWSLLLHPPLFSQSFVRY